MGLLLGLVLLDDGAAYGVGDGSGEESGDVGNGGFGGGMGFGLDMVDIIGEKWARLDERVWSECVWEGFDGNKIDLGGMDLVALGWICAGGPVNGVVDIGELDDVG